MCRRSSSQTPERRAENSSFMQGRQHAFKHGARKARTGAYRSWQNMKQRCLNPNAADFANWGGRGILVCDRWRFSFENFLEDMGERPLGRTLDRIDNDGDYTPENCRWATLGEQNNNQRRWRIDS